MNGIFNFRSESNFSTIKARPKLPTNLTQDKSKVVSRMSDPNRSSVYDNESTGLVSLQTYLDTQTSDYDDVPMYTAQLHSGDEDEKMGKTVMDNNFNTNSNNINLLEEVHLSRHNQFHIAMSSSPRSDSKKLATVNLRALSLKASSQLVPAKATPPKPVVPTKSGLGKVVLKTSASSGNDLGILSPKMIVRRIDKTFKSGVESGYEYGNSSYMARVGATVANVVDFGRRAMSPPPGRVTVPPISTQQRAVSPDIGTYGSLGSRGKLKKYANKKLNEF